LSLGSLRTFKTTPKLRLTRTRNGVLGRGTAAFRGSKTRELPVPEHEHRSWI